MMATAVTCRTLITARKSAFYRNKPFTTRAVTSKQYSSQSQPTRAQHAWQSDFEATSDNGTAAKMVANVSSVARRKTVCRSFPEEGASEKTPASEFSQEKRAKLGLKPGQLDPQTAAIFKREHELAERKLILKNFWYIAEFSENIRDKPVGVEMLGKNLLLVRDSMGVVKCYQNACPHRGAPLHDGTLEVIKRSTSGKREHKCIVCPYHGWAFDLQKGRLRDIPSSGATRKVPVIIIDSYHVEEKGGIVWLFFGSSGIPDEERPPIPFIPELEDTSWKAITGSFTFDCNFVVVQENLMDMAHVAFLHEFGNRENAEIQGMKTKTLPFCLTATFAGKNKAVNPVFDIFKVPKVEFEVAVFLPGVAVVKFTLGRNLSFITFVCPIPVSHKKTVNRYVFLRKLSVDPLGSQVFNMKILDGFVRHAVEKIFRQDQKMIQTLAPDALQKEYNAPADQIQLGFRKLRKVYLDQGYGVDL